MKILLITQHYHPEPNFITTDIAKYLAQEGHEVTVLTAHPNYPYGRFYDSVKSLWPQKTYEDKVKVWRLPFYPDHSLSKIKRLLSYLSFCVIASLVSPFIYFRPKLTLVYQTPFTTAIAALFPKWIYRSKLIFICADLWPESFTASGVAPKSGLLNLMYQYSRWINRRADHIVAVTQGILTRYTNDKISREKLSYIPVWVETPDKNFEIKIPHNQKPILIYAGNIGPAQALDLILEASSMLQSKGIDILFHIYGIGTEYQRLQMKTKELGLNNIIFFGRVSSSYLIQAIQGCDGQIVHLVPSPLFKMTVPSKLYFSLSLGKPIFCGVEGESLDIAKKSGACFAFIPNDSVDLANKIEAFLKLSDDAKTKMCHNARQFFLENFAKDKLLLTYKTLIENLKNH